MQVPEARVGKIIGPKGQNISNLKEKHPGLLKLQVDDRVRGPEPKLRTIHITATSPDVIDGTMAEIYRQVELARRRGPDRAQKARDLEREELSAERRERPPRWRSEARKPGPAERHRGCRYR